VSGSVWLPGLIVLAVGAGFGLFLIWRLKGQKSAAAAAPDVADLELRVRDLEGRRDDLYRRIRRIHSGEDIGDATGLEIEAARVLRQLDLTVAELPHKERRKAARSSDLQPAAASAGVSGGAAGEAESAAPAEPAKAAEPAEKAAAAGDKSFFGTHPLLAGFTFGIAMAALVGALIWFAVADAKPKPPGMGGPPPAPAGDALPDDPSERLDALMARLQADPNDLMAMKEIGLLLLQGQRWVEAFEVGGMILQQNPGDPDGLYVQGVVRLRMGQSDEARNIFDEILANWPQHIPAMMYRGLAFYQGGNVEQAVDTWEFALDRSGDMRPQFESMIAMVQQGQNPLEAIGFTGTPGGAHPPDGAENSDRIQLEGVPADEIAQPATEAAPAGAAPPAATGTTAAERPMPAGDASGYTVRVELGAGAQVPAGATLFVYLRAGDSGPPVAVKRMPAAAFPIDVFISQDDSMMGSALPEAGNIVVRVDSDGNVMSRGPGDLETSQAASMGGAIRVVLGG
jgi:cytochrome c-type biogenesis protein CcmH